MLMNFLTSLLAFIVAIGLLVTIHELGHYLVMRWCGVRVLRFAFGFGKVLWSLQDRAGTEWAICLWPLGGYVKPLDTRETATLTAAEQAQAFDTQSVGKRIAMVAAGPLANFALAILLYWVVFMNGVFEWRPILAEPPLGSPAAAAGVQAGDLVTRVDGETVATWSAFQWHLLQTFSKEREVSLAVAASAQGQTEPEPDRGLLLTLPAGISLGPELLPSLGLRLITPDFEPVIGVIQPESAASAAGLQPGDRIERINAQVVTRWSEVVKAVRSHPDQVVSMQIGRGEQTLTLSLIPRAVEERISGNTQRIGKAGLGPVQDVATLNAYRIRQDLGVLEALKAATVETWDKSRFTLVMLGQMVSGRASLENLSGPVTIATAAGQTARIGPEAFLRFLAIVSLSLAVINLLPLPLLDGGHLMYYLVEIIIGRPVSAEYQAILQRFGVALLGIIMFIALFNDLQRMINVP
jgi:regulator of sigma E protease